MGCPNPPLDFEGRGTAEGGGGAAAKPRNYVEPDAPSARPSTSFAGPPALQKQGRI